jgi:hypothetical protein
MAESQITISVDREILREFRAECIRRDTTPTKTLAVLMAQQLHAWLTRTANAPTLPQETPHET